MNSRITIQGGLLYRGRVISGPNIPKRFYPFLERQVQDRGTIALEKILYLIEMGDDESLILRPSMCALIYWGDAGLVKIKDLVVKKPTPKYISGSLSILSCLSAGRPFNSTTTFNFYNDEFTKNLNTFVSSAELSFIAKEILNEITLSIDPLDLLMSLSTIAMASVEPGKVHEDSIRDVVHALSNRWLHFGTLALKEYEALVKQNPLDEDAFQKFFEKYPQLLDPMAMQVWSKPVLHGGLIPDFLIRRVDNTYLVVEIECPGKRIVTQANQFTHAATHAEKQALEYQSFLNDRSAEMEKHFPFMRDIEGLSIVGIENELNADQRAALARANRSRYKLKTVGFDWILERARSTISNMHSMKIEVMKNHRVV